MIIEDDVYVNITLLADDSIVEYMNIMKTQTFTHAIQHCIADCYASYQNVKSIYDVRVRVWEALDPTERKNMIWQKKHQHTQVMPESNPDRVVRITDRELEVCVLIIKGMKVGDIAKTLNISPHTVASYVTEVKGRIGAHTPLELAKELLRRKLITMKDFMWSNDEKAN